jgi:hypothetical protein
MKLVIKIKEAMRRRQARKRASRYVGRHWSQLPASYTGKAQLPAANYVGYGYVGTRDWLVVNDLESRLRTPLYLTAT